MPNKKHMWLLEIAEAFGMDFSQFAKETEFSRAALYKAARGELRLRSARVALAIFKLEIMNRKMLEAELTKAEENFSNRKQMIDRFKQRLSD